MVTVRLVGGDPPYEEIFVSVERTPLVLAEVRGALPGLKKELARKLGAMHVAIEVRGGRRRNPVYLWQAATAAGVGAVGIAVRYIVGPALKSGIADPVGAEIRRHVTRWLKRFRKSKRELSSLENPTKRRPRTRSPFSKGARRR